MGFTVASSGALSPAQATEPGQAFVADGVGGGVWRHINDHGGFRYKDLVTGYTIVTPTSYTLINPVGIPTHLEGFTQLNGRLTYDGVNAAHAFISVGITFKHSSGGGEDIYFELFKNGVSTGEEDVQTANSTGFDKISIQDDTDIVSGDYFEMFVKAASGSVVIHSEYMFALTMPEGS